MVHAQSFFEYMLAFDMYLTLATTTTPALSSKPPSAEMCEVSGDVESGRGTLLESHFMRAVVCAHKGAVGMDRVASLH